VQVLAGLNNEDDGDDHPENVEEGKVKVDVVRVRIAVRGAFDHCGEVVKNGSIELAHRNDQLNDVACWAVVVHGIGDVERQRTPGELKKKHQNICRFTSTHTTVRVKL